MGGNVAPKGGPPLVGGYGGAGGEAFEFNGPGEFKRQLSAPRLKKETKHLII